LSQFKTEVNIGVDLTGISGGRMAGLTIKVLLM